MEVSDLSPTSHLETLIDQIELILTSPADFTSSTAKTLLAPLLAEINTCEEVDELHDRVVILLQLLMLMLLLLKFRWYRHFVVLKISKER